MPRLYGVISHAVMRKTLRKYRRDPFCNCCRLKKKTIRHSNDDAHILHRDLVQFLAKHHLSVLDLEVRLEIDQLRGRVDAIFMSNIGDGNTIYIIDWKFIKHIPTQLSFDYVMQLNLYKYIMQHMSKYCHYIIEMYCVMLSSQSKLSFKAFKPINLPDDYIKSLFTNIQFS